MKTKKLYKVRIIDHGYISEAYVVATGASDAYNKYRRYLNKHDLGFCSKREMQSVELLAEELDYEPDCGRLLIGV